MLAKYIKFLTPVKTGDNPRMVASAARMNAIQECIKALARGENISSGLNIRKRAGEGWVILNALSGGGGSSSVSKTPFLVYPSVDNTDPPYPILKVYPGKIGGIVPTLAAAKLDVPDTAEGLKPWFYPPGTPFSFYLRVTLGIEDDIITRLVVTAAKVLTDDDEELTADTEGEDGEVTELKIYWDDTPEPPIPHQSGHFYIRIADVDMTQIEGNIIFKDAVQWLFSSYATFAVSDTAAIPIL